MSKKRISFLVSLLFALFLLYNEQHTQVAPETQVSAVAEAQATSTDQYLVSRVVDGDTIEVTKNGVKEKVRLLGINTPETVDPRKKVECFGKEASAHAKELLTGKQVKLVTDDTQTKYDKYGRLLAYVYREDGLFVNKHMISEGYAHEYTYTVPYIFQKEFKEAQKQAESDAKGLWKVGVCEKI